LSLFDQQLTLLNCAEKVPKVDKAIQWHRLLGGHDTNRGNLICAVFPKVGYLGYFEQFSGKLHQVVLCCRKEEMY